MKANTYPWLPTATNWPIPQHIAIIGAGIAGATLANQLAQLGMNVDIFESESAPAQLASGNLAGNCLPIIDARPDNPYAQWHWQAWRTTVDWWQQQPNRAALGQLTGAAKWSNNSNTLAKWRDWASHYTPELVEWRDALPLAHRPAGLWFPQGGYLRPQNVVAQLLAHPRIRLHTHCAIQHIAFDGTQWQLHSQQRVFSAPAIALTTGAQTTQLMPDWHTFIQQQKGQATHVPIDNWQQPPEFALSYGGYATPAVDGLCCVGASFSGEAALGLTTDEQQHNLDLLNRHYPTALLTQPEQLSGHTAYRANTYDRLPMVGNMVNIASYQQALTGKCHQKETLPNLSHCLLPHLWLSIGHGSHGLTSSFLAAQLLAQQIAQPTTQLALIDERLRQAVHPARMVFRHICCLLK